jgi:hypothetical protein
MKLKRMYIKLLYSAPCVAALSCALSCGNPIIQDEYNKIANLGDTNVFQIAGPEDVSKFHAHPEGNFVLVSTDDIDMDKMVAGVFKGSVRGQGPEGAALKVSGMLFEETDGAVIRDIRIVSGSTPAKGTSTVGMVAGKAKNTKFINVRLEGTNLNITRADSGTAVIGGIVGTMQGGEITRCSTVGPNGFTMGVTAAASTIYAGGLVGQNMGGTITYSFFKGALNGGTASVRGVFGGLAGTSSGTITQSYNAGTVGGTATDPNSGFVGSITGENNGTIENCGKSPSAGPAALTGTGTAASGTAPNGDPNWLTSSGEPFLRNNPEPAN